MKMAIFFPVYPRNHYVLSTKEDIPCWYSMEASQKLRVYSRKGIWGLPPIFLKTPIIFREMGDISI